MLSLDPGRPRFQVPTTKLCSRDGPLRARARAAQRSSPCLGSHPGEPRGGRYWERHGRDLPNAERTLASRKPSAPGQLLGRGPGRKLVASWGWSAPVYQPPRKGLQDSQFAISPSLEPPPGSRQLPNPDPLSLFFASGSSGPNRRRLVSLSCCSSPPVAAYIPSPVSLLFSFFDAHREVLWNPNRRSPKQSVTGPDGAG